MSSSTTTTSNSKTQIPSSIPNLSPEVIKNTGLINLTEKQQSNALYVTNISKTATIKQVSEFFSYCGTIEKIVQDFDINSPKEDPKQFSVVVFDSDQSYSVALLLGASVIEGSPINVHPYTTVIPHQQQTTSTTTTTNTNTNNNNNERNATTVIASLIASGYIKGENLINEMKQQAKELDSHSTISQKVKQAYTFSIDKCKKFNNQYKLTETFTSLKNKAIETTTNVYKNIDATLGLEQKAKEAKEFTLKTVSVVTEKAMEIEPVQKSVEFVTSGWNYIKDQWNNMTEETSNEISKQKISKTKPEQTSTTTTTTDTQQEQHIEVKKIQEDLINLEDESHQKK